MSTAGRSLELFFINGRPDGMLTAEVFNWTGHVLRLPRTQLKQALQRPETKYTGVYVLLGERDGTPLAYIGESEDLGERLRSHAAKKDWWDTAILITSAANNLHKAHVKYLEARLVEIAREVGTMPLDNGNTPPRSSLSEAATSNMESFLETLQMVLPAIRVDMFLNKARPAPEMAESKPDVPPGEIAFIIQSERTGVNARAILKNGEMVVQLGSKGRREWVAVPHNYLRLFEELRSAGVTLVKENHQEFTQNYAFSSPSAAAAILNGRPSNGRTDWKLESDGRTYEQWEADELAKDDT
ncbi:GIY-YIG nuclease family protein [Halocynthiibacter styelae]|uniref:GIY-YIG nuclease family protein n=1 Tax=Halocynthiibacter styelae TaxID=2761955 RepID=A0A8J7LP57_9RHOB|nr:GIY-YIG nuclease family protein [Paenihalocynthiibacter styelae]MBI1492362.1 GIY-YIG nuclease family protein [Paenihalocynthiibacter styelae]